MRQASDARGRWPQCVLSRPFWRPVQRLVQRLNFPPALMIDRSEKSSPVWSSGL